MLIGGKGSDSLAGGSGDDLLIAGNTDFDTNVTALMSVLAEWSRTDLGTTYGSRIAHLRGTVLGGMNGMTFLTAGIGGTVHDDSPSIDILNGGSGRDWFFARTTSVKKDTVINRVTQSVSLAEMLDEI